MLNFRILVPATKRRCGRSAASVKKNTLTAADAKKVEEAFQAKLATLVAHDAASALADSERPEALATSCLEDTDDRPRSKTVNKSVPALPEPRRIRDRDHVKFVAGNACLVCGRQPADAHHLRFAQNRALGRKVSDEFTVPLCRGHHREVHRSGNEVTWWSKVGIDPSVTARALWLETHPQAG